MTITLRTRLGRRGEDRAADLYRSRGAEIIDRNVYYPVGELDLIAREPDGTIVFVEVKTRKDESFAAAREFVTPAKQERVRKTAMLWLQQNDVDLQPRFDVIEIVGQGRRQTIRHMENAF